LEIKMKPVSVLLIDDNPTFLRATTQFLEAHEDMAIVGTFDKGEEALAQVLDLRPQVVLVDLAMINLPGLQVIPRLRKTMPQVGIIALTLMNSNNFRQAALKAGADDFIPKATMRTDLIPAIQKVARSDRKGMAEPTALVSDNGSKAVRRLLVIEDNAELRRLYSRALGRTGFEVHTAGTIQQAQEMLDNSRFDVLLCDVHMGSDRGTDLLREYGDTLATSGTLIIVVSGQSQYRSTCEDLGADFFLEKPVAINTLVTLLNRVAAQQ
jgi:DNA-binding NarL/FixJ family response regulator